MTTLPVAYESTLQLMKKLVNLTEAELEEVANGGKESKQYAKHARGAQACDPDVKEIRHILLLNGEGEAPVFTSAKAIILGFHTQAANGNTGPLEQAKARAEKGLEWAPRIKGAVGELVDHMTAERYQEENQGPGDNGKKRKHAHATGASSSSSSSTTSSSSDTDKNDEIEGLKGKNERLEEEIRAKDVTLKAATDKASGLQGTIDRLKQEIATASSSATAKDATITRLNGELTTAKSKASELIKTLASHLATINTIRKQRDTASSTITEKDGTITRLNGELTAANTAISTLENNRITDDAIIKGVQKNFTEAKNKNIEHEATIKGLQSSLTAATERIKVLEPAGRKLEEEKAKLTEELSHAQQSKDKTQQQLNDLQFQLNKVVTEAQAAARAQLTFGTTTAPTAGTAVTSVAKSMKGLSVGGGAGGIGGGDEEDDLEEDEMREAILKIVRLKAEKTSLKEQLDMLPTLLKTPYEYLVQHLHQQIAELQQQVQKGQHDLREEARTNGKTQNQLDTVQQFARNNGLNIRLYQG